MSLVHFLIFFHFFNTLTVVSTFTSGQSMHRLYENLLDHYEKDIRPSTSYNETLNVTFAFSLAQIIDVDEKNQIITTNTWINQVWTDSNLKWNASEYENISTIHIPNNKVWLPDIVLYNNADSHYKKAIVSTDVFVRSNGNVTWLSAAIFKSSCEMNVRYYPFDEQVCFLKFASWSYDGSLINLVSNNIRDRSNYMPNTEWDLTCLTLTDLSENFSCCPEEPFPVVKVTICIKRKPMFYVFNLILPCVLISSMSLLGFYMPSDSGEKVTLGTTTLLSITVFLLLVAENTPPTSHTLPLIGTYYIVTLILVSLTTICTVVTLNIHNKGESGYPLPSAVKIFAFKYLAPILLVTLDPPDGFCIETKSIDYPDQELQPLISSNARPRCASYSSCYSDSYSQSQVGSSSSCKKKMDSPNSSVENNSLLCETFEKSYLDALQKISSTIETNENREKKKAKHDAIKREWQQVAAVADRFLLYVFIIITVVSSLIIMYQKEILNE